MNPVRILDVPYARFLGVEIESSATEIVCRLPFHPQLVGNNRLPAVHGGVVGAFLELSATVGLIHQLPGQRLPKPINFNVNYLRSAGPSDTRGRAEIVKHGRRIANVRVVAWQDSPEKPIATGVGNFLL